MAGRLLPDSNALIALMRGDEGLVDIFDAASKVVLSVVVLGELAYGAMNSRSVEANLAKLTEVASACRLALVDEPVAREYARVPMTAVEDLARDRGIQDFTVGYRRNDRGEHVVALIFASALAPQSNPQPSAGRGKSASYIEGGACHKTSTP